MRSDLPSASESESEFERLFDLSLDLFCIAGFDGYFKRVNPAFERALGYSSQELLSRPFMELVHPDDRESVESAMSVLAGGEDILGFECRLISADGSARWVEWNTHARPEDGVVYAVGRDVTDRHQTSDALSALRRVATLVAEDVEPERLFAAAAEEVARVVDVPLVSIVHFESNWTATEYASFSTSAPLFEVGTRWSLEGTSVLRAIRETSKAARIDDYGELVGEIAEAVRRRGIVSRVGVPVIVAGRLWGAMVVSSDIEPLSAGTEERLTDFTELLATAIENAEAREAVQRLADEQAALRRVATLVAEAAAPSAVLDAVAGEMQALLGADEVALNRFEPDTEIVVLAHRGLDVDLTPVGSHVSHEGENVTSIVRRTGSPARMENYERAAGALAELARSTSLRSSVSAPITVEGQVWGLVTASWKGGESPPADTEDRMAKFAHLIDTAIANTEARAEIERLADEQAALRQVATLVAEGVGRAEIFAAVSEQVARVFRLDVQTSEVATAVRFDPGPESVLVGTSKNIEGLPLGSRWEPKELYVSTKVLRSRRPSRLDEEELAAMGGPDADELRRQGFLSQVGSPILAEGRLWGAITVNSGSKLPPDAEQRLEKFTELIATAISNAESREDLSRLAQEQAALRRVATLVARETAADAVFAAVGREVGQLLGVDATHIGRYDPDGTVVSVAQWGSNPGVPIGARFPLDGDSVSARVLRTGRPARMDYYESAPGVIAATMRQLGIRFSIGVPISIEGRPWGVMIATSEGPSPFPTDIESRLQDFTELVATSIANAENRSELASSRARIVAASDDARRRIERDLHDGVQQQLVSLRLELGGLTADPPAGDALREQLAGVTEEVGSILDALVEIARGIHPAILSHGGLEAALHSLARRSAVPVTLEARIEGSLADEVEVAAYYVASEALTNVAKHARASVVHIDVTTDDGTLTLAVRDDGVGGADLREGSGLVGLRDRIEALGGTIAIDSPAERGTRLLVTLPLATEPDQEVGR